MLISSINLKVSQMVIVDFTLFLRFSSASLVYFWQTILKKIKKNKIVRFFLFCRKKIFYISKNYIIFAADIIEKLKDILK